MRTTRYIGLNYQAINFIKDAISKEKIVICQGMFFEDVIGHRYITSHGSYKEVLQVAPWSSGPMIFTCLQDEATGEKLFEWIEDTTVQGCEVDYEKGTFYIL